MPASMIVNLFRMFGAAGIVLLGASLALAPIYAFGDRMIVVSALGIAGIACLLVAYLLRRFMPTRRDSEATQHVHADTDGDGQARR